MGTLLGGGRKFSKGLLKRFTHGLFVQFLRVSLEDVWTIPFWDRVGFNKEEIAVHIYFIHLTPPVIRCVSLHGNHRV